MNRFLLYLIMLPKTLWARLGADTTQLRAILDVRLKMDDRKPAAFGRQRAQKKGRRFASLLMALVSFVTGIIYILPLIIVEDAFSGIWLFFTMFLFLLTLTLITDFSSVLVDTRDKYIVLPRPVNDRTLFLSRVLHMFIYLIRIVLPMSLPGWIAVGILYGWKAAVLFPLPVLLLTLTALFAVMGIYLIMLRAASAARFKELLSYFQIVFSVVVFGTYYLVPRGADSAAFRAFNIHKWGWGAFTPPYWLAATFSWVHPFQGTHLALYGLLAVLLPAACLLVTVRWLAPQFTARLGALDAADAGDMPLAKKSAAQTGRPFYQSLARMLNIRPDAQAGFIMAWIQTGRSRSFKMRVYPMFAYVPIYFVYLMLQSQRPMAEVWQDLPNTGRHVVLLYMCSIVMLQAFAFMTISEQYKAAWIYRAMPLAEPGAILSGAAKVAWIKYFLPFFAAVSAFVLYVWGLRAITDVLLAMVNVTLFAACVLRTSYRKFPFSQVDQTAGASGGSRFLRGLIGMSIPAALGIGHYFALDFLWLKALFLALSSILLWLVWDSYAHTSWDVIQADE